MYNPRKSDLVQTILLAMVMFLLPIKQGVLSVVLLAIIINFFIIWYQRKTMPMTIDKTFLKWSLGYVFLYSIGLLKMDNFEYAQFDLIQKASIVLVGFLIFSPFVNYTKVTDFAKKSFIAGNLIGLILCFSLSFSNYLNDGDMQNFTYGKFSHFLHTSYFSMYLCFSIAILINDFMFDRILLPKTWMYFILICFFSIGVYLVASKTGLIVLPLIFIIFLFNSKLKSFNLNLTKKLVLASSMIVIVGMGLKFDQNRIVKTLDEVKAISNLDNEVDITTQGKRWFIWKSSFQVIENNFWFGVGTGDDNYALLDQYKSNGYDFLADKKLNAHNQYLQTFITLGFGGFLFFLVYSFLPLYYGWKHKDMLLISFALIIIINSLTESVFNRQAGIIFWTLWGFLLMSNLKTQKDNKTLLVE